MNTIITLEDIRAYAEVDYIINHMNQRYIDMLPKKLVRFFHEMKDPDYEVKVDPHKPLQSQNLSEYALELIALMHLKYWCADEKRKQELYQMMLQNDSNITEKLYEKSNIDAVFENFEYSIKEKKESNDDFSRPREVQTVNIKKEEVEEKVQNTEETEEKSLLEEQKLGFFARIKEKVLSFFSRNK